MKSLKPGDDIRLVILAATVPYSKVVMELLVTHFFYLDSVYDRSNNPLVTICTSGEWSSSSTKVKTRRLGTVLKASKFFKRSKVPFREDLRMTCDAMQCCGARDSGLCAYGQYSMRHAEDIPGVRRYRDVERGSVQRGGGGGMQRETDLKFSYIAGVVDAVDRTRFERQLFRTTRGNCYVRFAEIEQAILDPVTGESMMKLVFIVFYKVRACVLPGYSRCMFFAMLSGAFATGKDSGGRRREGGWVRSKRRNGMQW